MISFLSISLNIVLSTKRTISLKYKLHVFDREIIFKNIIKQATSNKDGC